MEGGDCEPEQVVTDGGTERWLGDSRLPTYCTRLYWVSGVFKGSENPIETTTG